MKEHWLLLWALVRGDFAQAVPQLPPKELPTATDGPTAALTPL